MVKIDYAFETISISPTGVQGGVPKDEAAALINGKIAREGWDRVDVQILHKNTTGDQSAGSAITSVVVMYILYKNVPDAEVKAKTK